MSKIKLSAVAIAAMGVFSGAANAATTQYIAMSGSSALRTTTLNLIQTLCGGSAEGFAASTADGGSNVRAYRCGGVNGKVFSLDTDGGSWRAYGTEPSALAVIQAQAALLAVTDPSIKQIRYLDMALCPAAGGVAPATVACTTGAAKPVVAANDGLNAPNKVSIGFTDVNAAHFDGVTGVNLGEALNRPNGFAGWKKFTSASSPVAVLGVVFGVAGSRTLIEAMMADQGITAAARPECYTAGAANLSLEACAPTISKDQYRSIATSNFGALNTDFKNLFKNAVPAAITAAGVTLQRRDWGSGTQSAANAYFHGVGCTPYFLTPAAQSDSGAPYIVNENAATSDVIAALSVANAVSVGVVSRENSPTATGGWGFMKLSSGADRGGIYVSEPLIQAGYPNAEYAAKGLYDFWTVAWAHFNTTDLRADVATIKTGLTNGTNLTLTNGTFKLNALSGTNLLPKGAVTTGTYYNKDGMTGACGGALSN